MMIKIPLSRVCAAALLVASLWSTSIRGQRGGAAADQKTKGLEYLGKFEVATHEVQGQLYAGRSDGGSKLFVSRFYYDGEGPDYIQFLLVDADENDYSKGLPLGILEKGGSDKIDGPVFNEDLTLVIPQGYGKVKDGDKLVVWCHKFEVSFGRVKVDRSLERPAQAIREVGTFIEPFHSVSGTLYIVNESTLLIKEFNYDGQGPSVTFLAGKNDTKVGEDGVVVPYPYNEKIGRLGSPKLKKVKKMDITLRLPESIKSSEVKWLSVWCDIFGISFGHVIF